MTSIRENNETEAVMTDDKFGKQCPVCGKRITPAFLDRHIGIKHNGGKKK